MGFTVSYPGRLVSRLSPRARARNLNRVESGERSSIIINLFRVAWDSAGPNATYTRLYWSIEMGRCMVWLYHVVGVLVAVLAAGALAPGNSAFPALVVAVFTFVIVLLNCCSALCGRGSVKVMQHYNVVEGEGERDRGKGKEFFQEGGS